MKKALSVLILILISVQQVNAADTESVNFVEKVAVTVVPENVDVGDIAAVFGAEIGTGVALGAIYAGGITGFGATGVTSGLAAVGSIVGGGMTAGLVVTAAAPIAGSVAAYGLYKWLKN